MRIRNLLAVASLFIFQIVSASDGHTMRDAWIAMPDSMLTYLNENMRRELVELADMGAKADVRNVFQEETVLDSLSDCYMCVRLNESVKMQMRMLAGDDSARIICQVRTFYAPEAESSIRFYTEDWSELTGAYGLPDSRSEDYLLDMFTARPDTMSQQRYEELRDMIDPVMLSADLSEGDDTISFTLGMPLLDADEKKAVEVIIKQRFFKWDGKIFKEC